ncbi:MAG: type VI secretion system contractile sheath protein TssC [Chitinophagaceae bacterium]
MPEEKELQNIQAAEKVAERPLVSVEQGAASLVKFGGFAIVETTIDGAQNLNPEKKARKKIFLSESEKKAERDKLKKRLALIYDLLASADNVPALIEQAQNKADAAQTLLNKNILKALEATRELEQSYRTVNYFFKNTGSEKVKNVYFMNAAKEQLNDLDNTVFIDAVSEELKKNYDRLDLRDNFSLLCVPGYLGSKKVVDKWARMAYQNKVMLITDFQHLDAPDDVLEEFESAKLTGGDAYLSNVMMACNYLVGRGKQSDVGEEEDVYVPPSSALTGLVYQTLMSQVAAGRKFGALNEVDAVKFPLKKSEIAQLEKAGLIPMVNEYGKVMPFSAKTLFNGDNLGLQTYSVVRVFDYVTKVLIDFLNRRAFENFNVNTRMDIQKQIVKFLDSITGPGKLIEKFKILRFDQDPNQKDRIFLDIHMTPYFPAKNFMIKLDGQKGDDPDSAEWKAEYEQSK